MSWRRTVSLACGVMLLGGAGSPLALAQEAPVVKQIEIRHVGPPAVSDPLIRANIRVKEGDSYRKSSVDDDVSSLWKTGFFYNIRVVEEAVDDGLKLIYVVQGNPTLTQINFTGNKKYSDAKLLKKLSSKVGEPLNERKLFNDSQEILKRYQKAGLQKTQVKYVPVIDDKLGKGTVTFEITEAPKIKIDDVVFVGAEAFKQGKLRRVIKTRRHWMFSWLTGSGVLKDDQFDEDKEKLAEFYRNEGYIDFQIRDIQFEQVNPKWMIIRIHVAEGTRYRVGTLDFEGNKLFPTPEIQTGAVSREGNKVRRGLSMGPGEVFTPKGLTRDREAVEDFYGGRGYIDAQVAAATYKNEENRKS